MLKTTVRLLNEYLDQYGRSELHIAVGIALKQQAHYPQAVQQILERRRDEQQKPPPLAVAVPEKVKHLGVKTGNVADYVTLYRDGTVEKAEGEENE